MVSYFNFSGSKNRYHALESGVTSLIPAVGNSWFKIQIFPSLLSTAILDGRFFLRVFSLGLRWFLGYFHRHILVPVNIPRDEETGSVFEPR